MTRPARVFTVPPAAPFLPTLSRALVEGVLVPGLDVRADPMALAAVTVYLPTRRAARALAGALSDALGGGTVILPRILPLGDVDDDPVDAVADPVGLDLPPTIPPAERLVGLARLVSDWRRHVTADRLLTPSGQPIAVPTSAAEALHLAADLLALVDQAAAEGVDWALLRTLVPDDHAAWWQLTATFLEIATTAWPAHLAERGAIDPIDRRSRMTRAIAARYDAAGSRGPVIAAGSTGSVPATATLLAAIARLPRGAVVLPGLDLDLDDATFADLTPDGGPGVPSHPQGAMARLLATIGIGRDEVRTLGTISAPAAARARIVSEALRPAETTERWPAVVAGLDADAAGTAAALDGLALVEAANEAEEALAVAVALRETLETPGATAALVTPDRGLARRVAAELRRFGVEAEDSAGEPLARTRLGVLALLVAEVVAEGAPPEKVVALVKHPLVRFGLPPDRLAAAARALEVAVLRGPRLAAGVRPLVAAADVLCRAGRSGLGVHPAVARLDAAAAADGRRLAQRLGDALSPLEDLGSRPVDLRVLVGAGLAALRAAARDESGSDEALFAGPAGSAFAGLMVEHLDARGDGLAVSPAEWPGVLSALMTGRLVRRPAPTARIAILGPLEARLLAFDRLVLGGLEEGVWPLATDTGPWLSRPMRAALAFSPPEVRIGLSAHDFTQSLGGRDVVLTRSVKREGAPTVATRFLQRLTGLIGETRTGVLAAAGRRFVAIARRLDDRPAEDRADRPQPKPPVTARPVSLSVTEIETWIRDPYAIYARRILRLEPLPALGERPHFGTRGSALHDIFARFALEWTGRPFDDAAVARLVAIGREVFDREFGAYPEIHALWWPRFVAAADFVVRDFEAGRDAVERLPEVAGELKLPAGAGEFRLRGRADRVDVRADGMLSIVDFKTGQAPTARQIATGNAPQLPLEGAIARRGGFPTLAAAPVADLTHVVLRGIRGRDDVVVYAGYASKDLTLSLEETIDEAERRLAALVAAYADPDKGYLSRAHPYRSDDAGPYDHLARVMEWSIGADGEDGE
ncbi:double-strand break repair protein AddB [Oharaeibacter diazotrophicus]|uniref:ATP-dependent helicase/nuclease subunit B n=2 Tax=Oharaeibacter diazotrophicus TaxID=1920512 RepID=A0A4R6RDP3_9HYPH|nr:double-strand break repair protein AddB [Oharaeibacter diazotrophicus]TDP84310.1 ATP-dependent helicase/nuclease subunit B [Oharaeibacter diazotrophicus]BBE73347.1 PD-(D/E)XK nuclease superfamily protein [Pleomorphomonas sp. SM30]GLS75138.1 double-strand break repair protein AddB [Oharaeibacter diazotrophicus]